MHIFHKYQWKDIVIDILHPVSGRFLYQTTGQRAYCIECGRTKVKRD